LIHAFPFSVVLVNQWFILLWLTGEYRASE
jgi:hypothetical protein